MIDGGKGQLSAALAGMRDAGVEDVPVVSLAKRLEEVFRPGIPDPLLLRRGLGGAARAAARPRRGPPLRAAPPPRAPRARHDRERPRRAPGRRAGAQGRAAAPLRLDRALPGRQPRGAGGGPGGAGEGGARGVRPPPQDRRAQRGRRGLAEREREARVELTVITGMSGAGKSQAMGAFEDAGWFCVDNLPPGLLPALADLFLLEGSRVERAAVVCDVRGGVWFKDLEPVLERVEEAAGVRPRVVFLEASDETLHQPLPRDPPAAPAVGRAGP